MKEVNISDEIKRLIELQELDSEIFSIKRELEAMPEKLREFDNIIKEKEEVFKESEENVKKLELKRKEKEIDLGTKEENIKKLKQQLYQIKTNKEYTVLEKEIQSQKADTSILEEEIIKILDEIDNSKKKVMEYKINFQQEKQHTDSEKKKIEEIQKEKESGLGELESRRREFVINIDNGILKKYEKILYAKDGTALVPILESACSGCNMNLPPQVINEVKIKSDLIFCGNCSRILYALD